MRKTLKELERFGNRYVKEHLSFWIKKRNALKTDWFKALDFFLWRVYFQGRRDELSEQYYLAAQKALQTYFGNEPAQQKKKFKTAWDKGFIPHDPEWKKWSEQDNSLWKGLTQSKAGKSRDIEMVLDIFRFISSCPSLNIVLYSLNEIRNGKTQKLYSEIDSIWQVGPKVTSFYLRDLAFLYDIKLSPEDFFVIQPIDTWVYQVAERIGIFSKKDSNAAVIKKLLVACDKAGVDPKKVNAGAWYLGANSFDILLNHIVNGGNVI